MKVSRRTQLKTKIVECWFSKYMPNVRSKKIKKDAIKCPMKTYE